MTSGALIRWPNGFWAGALLGLRGGLDELYEDTAGVFGVREVDQAPASAHLGLGIQNADPPGAQRSGSSLDIGNPIGQLL